MPRTPTAFADAELLAIIRALQQLDVAHADNRSFLRRAFDAIDRITGRTFGASVYRRLLAAAGVARSPSGQTVAAVIAERKAAPTAGAEAERRALLDEGLRGFLHKEIRVALDETGGLATLAPRAPGARVGAPAAAPVQTTTVTGEDAVGEPAGTLAALLTQRVATLEAENRQLRERAATAEADGRAAQAEVATLHATLASARAALADKEAGLVAALQAATEELARMGERQAAAERRRALETDNVRQAYRAERDALSGRVAFLEEELKTARAGVDAYRQALRGKG
ncbi:cell envelope biogenesis protein TolA [Cupriavidus pauculus]|uniref:cell envelope biogenesis protein TolA n=1 Tax=Cupriavidus pauculus TaxID=82633 RepID=UPI0012490915|nr:cell envelope biogenesis protein TolA [Cupriavidus pauculus]KAB0596389.1 cell envelope biogenesis protein TolA [Cupriavidus pauculus]MBY4733381.1 cell envelope biogenesis protein TolA [Cupriavidus pauculus]UAL03873.1 cell envelope biogenesis protein TolA [Cupriavidus pauculus]